MTESLELTDVMRAKLLVYVTGEDAAFIRRVVEENERLQADLALSRQSLQDTGDAYEAAMDENERLQAQAQENGYMAPALADQPTEEK